MNEDMNDVFQKLNSLLSDAETSDNLKNILNNLSASSTGQSSSNSSSDNTSNSDTSDRSSATFDFDIQTILKIKSIMDSFNSSQNDSRSNLLYSLKPYLQDSKKEKIDQYIKFLKIANVLELLNQSGGDIHNE